MVATKRKPSGKRAAKWHVFIRFLMICCVIGLVVSGYFLVQQTREYEMGNSAYSELRQVARPLDPPTLPEGSDSSAFVSPIDFDALMAVNGDTVVWLYSEGTVIDYPIVQGGDNSHYLNHLFTGERNKLGTLFLDHRNDLFEDRLSAVYGHNMRDKSMLTSIALYSDQAYYDQHPSMTLYLPEETYLLKVFAGVTVSGSSDALRFRFDDDDDFLDYLLDLKERSDFFSPEELLPSDRVIALVTCTYSFQNARYILFGKLEKVS